LQKQIIFKAVLNSSEFDQQVSKIQRKIQEAYSPASMANVHQDLQKRMQSLGYTSLLGQSKLGVNQDQNYKQSARELDNIVKEQWNKSQKLLEIVDKRLNKVKELRKEEQELLKLGKDTLEVKTRISAAEESSRRAQAAFRTRENALSSALDTRQQVEAIRPQGLDRLANAYSKGGIGGLAKAGTRMAGGILPLAGMGIAALATGMEYIDPMARSLAANRRVVNSASGSAISAISGEGLGAIYGNKGSRYQLFGAERTRAMEMALRERSVNRTMDNLSPITDILGQGAIGAASGATIGAAGGALAGAGILSPVFGAIGATGGGILGGIAGAGKGLFDMMGDPMKRAAALGYFSKSYQKDYEKLSAADIASKYKENMAAEEAKNPLKTLTSDYHYNNFEKNLQFQRKLGLSDEGMFGPTGFLDRGLGAGFTRESLMGMSENILGAGGSTGAARSMGTMGLAMERNMNMQNAGSIIGKLSNAAGTNSEQGMIKILSEGMKLGLDKSEFAAEQSKFADLTAQYIMSAGASTAGAQTMAAGEFSSRVFGNSMANIQGAQSATDFINQATSNVSGVGGAIFASNIESNPLTKGLSMDQKMSLSQLSEGQITSSNPIIQGIAEEKNMSPEDLAASLKSMKMNSVLQRSSTQNKANDLNKMYETYTSQGMSDQEAMETIKSSKEGKILMGQLSAGIQAESGVGMGEAQAQGLAATFIRGNKFTAGVTQTEQEAIDKKLGTPSERLGDKELEAIANQQSMVNKNFKEMSKELNDAAEAAKKMTKETVEMMLQFQKVVEGGENASEYLKQMKLKGAPQVGRPRQ
jgi:hypothetical protein